MTANVGKGCMTDSGRNQRKRHTGKLGPKLIRTVLLVVSAAFVGFFAIVATQVFQASRAREIDNQRSQLTQTAGRIQSLQSTIQNIASLIVYNDVVQRGISGISDTLGDELYAARRISNTLKEYLHIVDGTEEITIYTTDGQTFTSRYVRGNMNPEKTEWFREFLDSGRESGFTGVHSSIPMQSGYTTDVISYITGYYSIDNYRNKLGELIINVEYKTLEDMTRIDPTLLRGYVLLSSEGRILVESGQITSPLEEIRQGVKNGIYQPRGGGLYVVSDQMDDGWLLISQISGTALLRRSLTAVVPIFIVFVMMLVVLGFILSHMIRRVTDPINALSQASGAVGRGDFSVKVDIRTDDEVEDLAKAFNRMVVNINDLMNASVEHEKKIQQMQMENLLLQINPHFIYNTMNSIVYMARMSGNKEIADFTNAFISFLQGTLRVRSSIYTSLGEDLKNAGSYLYLQSYRYGNKFTWEIDCPPELEGAQIVSVMLQPVVENAIFHGIAPRDGPGRIWIEARRTGGGTVTCDAADMITETAEEERTAEDSGAEEKSEEKHEGKREEKYEGKCEDKREKKCEERHEGKLRIVVRDDGIGMDEQTLEQILDESYVQKGGIHKIGLGNVLSRIREAYGEEGSLRIESIPGRGTSVIIEIPYAVRA